MQLDQRVVQLYRFVFVYLHLCTDFVVLNWGSNGANLQFASDLDAWSVWSWFNVFCTILGEEDFVQFMNLDPQSPDFQVIPAHKRYVSPFL